MTQMKGRTALDKVKLGGRGMVADSGSVSWRPYFD
jgi:hypothetical protein